VKIFGIKFIQPPKFVPKKYHFELECWARDLAQEVHRKALGQIENDDDFIRVANMDSAIESCPTGLLKMLAEKDPSGNWVAKRVSEIRESKLGRILGGGGE
jgi:hypothetical protein